MNTKRVTAAADVICAAMKSGKAKPLSWAAALESACLLQSPESAAEVASVREALAEAERAKRELESRLLASETRPAELEAQRERYRIAWRMAYQRAQVRGWAADRSGERVRQGQTAMQDMLERLLGMQMVLNAARARVAELEAEVATAAVPQHDRMVDAADTLRAARAEVPTPQPPVCPVRQNVAARCTCFGKTPGGAS
ncbi:hypothetical protein OG705_29175 [Streptomyces sp. NBC_00838]|uniref:hypothetical protein n=1 Tax=Streptomyces sp. NBC_00838 TaxID=2903680 RepID=UPI003866C7A5|nr:hypothetical protein OG705_29175 [Streptomyces sp. NBC_00838]